MRHLENSPLHLKRHLGVSHLRTNKILLTRHRKLKENSTKAKLKNKTKRQRQNYQKIITLLIKQ